MINPSPDCPRRTLHGCTDILDVRSPWRSVWRGSRPAARLRDRVPLLDDGSVSAAIAFQSLVEDRAPYLKFVDRRFLHRFPYSFLSSRSFVTKVLSQSSRLVHSTDSSSAETGRRIMLTIEELPIWERGTRINIFARKETGRPFRRTSS